MNYEVVEHIEGHEHKRNLRVVKGVAAVEANSGGLKLYDAEDSLIAAWAPGEWFKVERQDED
jgi:hypothetical protein